jgi:ABC-type amino acid transport substrate-binding protein
MKKLFQYIAFFLITLVFSNQSAIAQMPEIELTETEAAFVKAHPVIKVANENDWPPFDYTELGKPKGFSIDLIRLLANKSGLQIEFVNGYTWNELLDQFKNKNIDVIPALYHNKERELFTLFTEPYHVSKMGVLAHKKRNGIKKVSDLIGKRVGIQQSDGAIPSIKANVPGIILVEHAQNEVLMNLLATHKLDAIIANPLLLIYLANRNKNLQLNIATYIETSAKEKLKTAIHVGVRKDYPFLHQILEKALKAVTNEEMAEIEEKWLFNESAVIPASAKVKLNPDEERFIQEHPVITLAGGLSFEPYVMYDTEGRAIGYDVDIAKLIEEKTGLKIRFELGIWNEIQEQAQKREFDGLTTATPTPERESYYNTSKPYFHYTPMVIVKKGNPMGIRSIDDISGKRAAIQRGNAFKNILEETGKEEVEIVYFDSIHDVIKAVVSEKADFMLFEESAFYIARQLLLGNMIEGAFTVGRGQGLHFLLRNDHPLLVTIINKGIKAITLSEKLEISNRWFGVKMGSSEISKTKIPLTPDEESYLLKKGTIKVCIDPTWMPYEHIREDGVYEGMSADYLKLFSDQIGVQTELYPTKSWAETLEAAKNGQCDLIPLAKASKERNSYLNFTTPYISFPYVIATKTDEFFIEDINQALDKKFAVVRGYLVADELRQFYPKIKLLEVANNKEGFEKVRSGEAYGYIGATATLAYALYQNNITDIKITGKLPWGFDLGVATRNDEPVLHDLFQKAVDTLTKEEKKRIHDKWIAVNVRKIVDYTLLWQILGLVSIIIAVLIGSRRRVSKANQKLTVLNAELVTALEEIKTLRGIIPICSYCKKIRDDKGMWNQLEAYLDSHSDAQFSHGACPECFKKQMEEIDKI